MTTVGQLLDFVLENRTNKVFKGFSDAQVAASIAEGLQDGTLFYAEKEGKLIGMILAIKIHKPKVLFVTENLAMSLDTLKQFAIMAQARFPGWKLEAMRHGKHRKFDTTKLYKKLHV